MSTVWLGGVPTVWHGDPATLPCGDCSHFPDDHVTGEWCFACCDGSGRCLPDEVDEDGNVIPPSDCLCCVVFRIPAAPLGTPRTHGTGIHGQRSDEVSDTWSAVRTVARILHVLHSPGTAIITIPAEEGVKALWKRRKR